jgi:hypothetical protein
MRVEGPSSRSTTFASSAAAVVALALAIAAALVTAVDPALGAICAVVLIALGAAGLRPQAAARVARWALVAAGVAGLVVLVLVVPWVAPIAVGAGIAIVAVTSGAASAAAPRLVGPIVAAAGVAGLLALAAWPVTVSLLVIVGLALLLARRDPVWAFGIGVLLTGFEGSIKILLAVESTPLPGSDRAIGSALIELALFAGVAGLIVRDRFETPRRVWRAAGRVERVALGALCAWFVLSVLQIAQNADLERGVAGFRLFQAYAIAAVAGLIAFAPEDGRLHKTRALLGIGLLVGLYATLRVITGPTGTERAFATSVETVTQYGGVVRGVGSFSSSVGIVSFLTPFAVFGLVLGYVDRRLRWLAWPVAVLALVGLIGSYGRASLMGVALGLVCACAVLVATADVSARRKLLAAGLVVLTLAGSYGALRLASEGSPQLRERAGGVLDPLQDRSAKLRFRTWRRTLRATARQPFGHGVGSVGGSIRADQSDVVTTDNSFLKVGYEQGIVVGFAFLAALLAGVVLLVRRLRVADPEQRGLGLAALAGFVAFLGIAVTGEYVEQPGKLVAWSFLGIAVAMACSRAPRRSEPARGAR